MPHLRAALLLLLCAVLGHLPGMLSGEWRGTEGRRVQIAVEMVERAEQGDPRAWMVPTLGWEDTLAKPPLYYWMLSGILETVGLQRWALRLPSVLGLWLVAWLAWGMLRRSFGEPSAWIAGVGIVTAPVLLHDGPYAEIDPVFAAFTAASLMCFARAVAWPSARVMLAAGVLGGLALLIKGPPYLMFWAPTVFVWWRRRRCRGWLWFVVPLLALPAAYYAPLLSSYVAPDTFSAVAGEESVGRLVTFEWHHVVDTPFYLLRVAGIVLPLGLWTFYEYRTARPAHVTDRELMLRVCKAAAIGGALVLTFFPGRPTRYLLPMVPLFVVAVAPAVAAWIASPRPMRPVIGRVLGGFGVLGGLGLVVVPFLPPPLPGRVPGFCIALGVLPLVVQRRWHVVAACFVLPVVASWTLFADREEYRAAGLRGVTRNAAFLHGELEARGLLPLRDRVASWGHMNSGLLLDLGRIPPGDEFQRHTPDAAWLLFEDLDGVPMPPLPDYREDLRLRWRDRDWVLLERTR